MTPDDTKLLPSTLISKRDYGIKIAKLGYDVNYASDTELLYNSSFPVLAMGKMINADTPREVITEGKISWWNEFNGTYSDRWVYNIRILHGLKYSPLVVPVNGDIFGGAGSNLTWDSKYIYMSKTFFTVGDYNSFVSGGRVLDELLVFAINIERDIEYPYFDYSADLTTWGVSNDYGMKYILNGEANNLNLEDLGINPNIQSLMVTAVKVTSDPDKIYYVPNGIDFRNLSAFCFTKTLGKWSIAMQSVQAVGGYRAVDNGDGTGYYRLDGLWFADTVSLVTVRMPFIAPDKASYNVNM